MSAITQFRASAAALMFAVPVGDIYVDQTANCSIADGTAAAPFCTVGEALAVAVSGDQVLVAPGFYRERVAIDADISLLGIEGQELTTIGGYVSGGYGSVIGVASGRTVTIEGLTIRDGDGWYGNGIGNGGSLTLRNSTVTGNSCDPYYSCMGAGIVTSGDLYVRGCRIENNRPFPDPYVYWLPSGGGILSLGADVVVIDSTISNNSGGAIGGGLGSSFSLVNTTVSSNTGDHAIYVAGDLSLRGCTVSGNSRGLVLFDDYYPVGATWTIESSTIVNNGAGIGRMSGSFYQYATATIRNSIVANNVGFDVRQDSDSLGHNLIERPLGTAFMNGVNGDIVGVDPQLGPLTNSGGPTATHALLPTSPAIDAGDPATFEPFDQRGFPRVASGADIGAYELQLAARVAGCPAAPNSTGTVALLAASGSFTAADNSLRLIATALPENAPGFFLASRASGFTPNPGGSDGNLCLSGAIGRFVGPGQVGDSGAEGRIELDVDLLQVPQPTGFVSAQAGDTWAFQCWYRDANSGATASNLSIGAMVTFR